MILKWTKETPTKSGYYYFRGKRFTQRVLRVDIKRDYVTGANIRTTLDVLTKYVEPEWAGPLPEPEEA